MEFNKIFSFFGMFILVISLLPIVVAEEVELQPFGEKIVSAFDSYKLKTGDNPGLKGGEIIEDSSSYDIYFSSLFVSAEKGFFRNIKPASDAESIDFIKIDKKSKKIISANFSIFLDETFIFGNNEFDLPANSRVVYDGETIKIEVADGSKLSRLPSILSLDYLFNGVEIEGKNIELPNDIEIVNGRVNVGLKGVLVESGEVISKDKLISVSDDSEKVLISNKKLNGYDGNWIYEDSNKLLINSGENGKINIKFLDGEELFNVGPANNLNMEVTHGDSLEINRGLLGDFPEVIHHSSEAGESRITNGNIGTFVYSKSDLMIEKSEKVFLSMPVVMKINSDSEEIDLGVEISSSGEVSMLKNNAIINTFNKDLSERLEGFSLAKLKKNFGEEWGAGLVDVETLMTQGFNLGQVNKIDESLSSAGLMKEDIYPILNQKYFDNMKKQGFTQDQSIYLVSKIINEGGFSINDNLLISLPSAIEVASVRGFSPEQSVDLISRVISGTGEESIYALQFGLPAVLDAGMSQDQSVELLSQIVKKSGDESEYALRSALPSADFSDLSKIDEISTGIAVYSKISPGPSGLKKINFASISDEETLGKELANSLSKEVGDLTEEELQRMAVYINKIHDSENELTKTDLIRTSFAKNSDFEVKYRLISEANSDLYTSTFLELYENFPEEGVIDSIRAIDPEGKDYVDFILQIANRGKSKELIAEDPSFYTEAVEMGISDEEKVVENTAFLTNIFIEYYENPEYSDEKEYFEQVLIDKYKNAKTAEEKGSYAFLLKLDKNPINLEVEKLSDTLPEMPKVTVPESWLADEEISMKAYYYEDELWFEESIRQYTSKKYNMKLVSQTEDTAELIQTINGKRIRIVLTKDNSDVAEAVSGDEFDIIAHRGHSFHLMDTFAGESNNDKLIYMGSCGSYCSFPEVQGKYPNSYLISDEDTGEGTSNNFVSYEVMRGIAEGEIEWNRLKPSSAIEDRIVFPGEKNQLLIKYLNNFK